MSETLMAPTGAQPTAPPGDAPRVQLDFVYNESLANATVAFGAIVTVITTGSIIARLYTRCFITKQPRIDDAWAVCALFSTIAVNIMQSYFAKRWLPTMLAMVEAGEQGSKIPYATGVVYNIAMACLKMTFLFQFYHIFRIVRVMRIVYAVAILIVAAWSLAQIFLVIFICVPLRANWDHTVEGAKCLPPLFSTYFNATGTILTDIIVLFLPLPTLWSLKLTRGQKWAAFGVFGIGAIVPLISTGRIVSLRHAPPKGYLSTACWTIAELGVGITCASLATIRHMLDRKANTVVSTHTDTVISQQEPPPPEQTGRGTGSEDNLISGNWSEFRAHQLKGSVSSTTKGIQSFVKEKVLRDSIRDAPRSPLHLNANKGTTRTDVSTAPDKRMTVSQGAAQFLGEFGILVEKTWEVEEIQMT